MIQQFALIIHEMKLLLITFGHKFNAAASFFFISDQWSALTKPYL